MYTVYESISIYAHVYKRIEICKHVQTPGHCLLYIYVSLMDIFIRFHCKVKSAESFTARHSMKGKKRALLSNKPCLLKHLSTSYGCTSSRSTAFHPQYGLLHLFTQPNLSRLHLFLVVENVKSNEALSQSADFKR